MASETPVATFDRRGMMSDMGLRAISPAVVGRREELSRLLAALDSAAEGRTSVTLVAGEAGVGKTRLLKEFMACAAEHGFRFVSGRCIDQGELSWPLAPLREIVGQLVEDLDRETLAAVLGGAGGVLAPFVPELERHPELTESRPSEPLSSDRFCELIVGVFRRLAVEGPVVVLVEDLHWADTSTRRLFDALARVARLGPLMLVGTFRSDELHRRHPLLASLAEIGRSADGQRIDLRPLDQAATVQLIAAIDAGMDAVGIDDIQRRSGGNPFYVEELVAARRSGINTTPRTLRDAVLSRAAAMGDTATDVLDIIAVAGRAPPTLLADVCALSADSLRPALDTLVASGLVVVDGDELRFRHELGREVFADELLPDDRTRIHLELARRLERGYPNRLGEIARHWSAASDPPRALVATVRAGRQAFQDGAAAEAEAHFSLALELWDAVDDAPTKCGVDHPTLACEAAVAAEHARHEDRAIELALSAINELAGQPAREGAVWLELRRIYRFADRWDECEKSAAMALALIPESPPSRERAEALAVSAMSALYADDSARAMEYALAAVAVAGQVADPNAMVDAHYALTMALVDKGDLQQALTEGIENAARCDQTVSAHRTMMAYNGVTACLSDLARLDELITFAQRAVDIARTTGSAGIVGGWLAAYWVDSLVMLGRWAEAERLTSDLADLLDDPAIEGLLARYWGAMTRQGRLEDARVHIANVRATLDRECWHENLHRLGAAVVEFDRADGHPNPTMIVDDLLARARASLEDTVILVLAGVTALADQCCDLDGGSRTRRDEHLLATAGRWMERIDPLAHGGRQPGPETQLLVDAAGAQLTRLRGRPEPERWAELAASSKRIGFRYEEALARFHHGEALLAGVAGRSFEARRAAEHELTLAQAIAADLAAAPLIRRISELAQRARLQLDTTESRLRENETQTCQAEHALTHRERAVLDLLTRGLSNRQIGEELFISTKTASAHVSNILRKLDVSNRVEAAAIAVRRQNLR
jgi:DNA-binding CsgD family transcriptional regulator